MHKNPKACGQSTRKENQKLLMQLLLLFYDLISLIKSFAEKGYNISSFLVWDVVQVNSAPKGAGFFDGNNGMNQHKEEIHDESNDCRPAI